MAKRETAPTTANIVPIAISTGRRARYKKIEKTKNKNARKYASSHKELLMKLPYWPQHKESAP